MKIGIIGSGVVAQTLRAKLVELGEGVVLGTPDPSKTDANETMACTARQCEHGAVTLGPVLPL